jgi:hypothetical protein
MLSRTFLMRALVYGLLLLVVGLCALPPSLSADSTLKSGGPGQMSFIRIITPSACLL